MIRDQKLNQEGNIYSTGIPFYVDRLKMNTPVINEFQAQHDRSYLRRSNS